jgi:hypothetical protein
MIGDSDDATKGLSVFVSVLTEEIDESLEYVTRQVVGADRATGGDGRAHLIEVGGAGIASGEVLFQAAALTTGKRAVEVVAHQFDGVAAYER